MTVMMLMVMMMKMFMRVMVTMMMVMQLIMIMMMMLNADISFSVFAHSRHALDSLYCPLSSYNDDDGVDDE